jgi:hypothetical protein
MSSDREEINAYEDWELVQIAWDEFEDFKRGDVAPSVIGELHKDLNWATKEFNDQTVLSMEARGCKRIQDRRRRR